MDEIKLDEGKVVVIFTAVWCSYCKSTKPRFKRAAAKHDGVKAIEVDVDKHESLADKYRIESMPTMVALNNGREVDRLTGGQPEKEIAALFAKVAAK